MSKFFDREGNSLTMKEWAEKFDDLEYRRVALTVLPNGYRISTVWLGRNHAVEEGPPLIFETMVFEGDSWQDEECERYVTLEEAQAGHEAVVKRWSSK